MDEQTLTSANSDLARDFGRMEGKIDQILATQARFVSDQHQLKVEVKNIDTKHEERIRKVENRLNLYAGGLAVITFLLAKGGSLLHFLGLGNG